ncbi:MAG: lysophospholipid acyltransferase family protein [Arachnia sp.]
MPALERPTTKPWRRPLRAVNRESAPFGYHVVVRVVRFFLPLLIRRSWRGQENIPTSGAALVVSNHLSNFDTPVLGEFVIWSGRWPRFLGKSEIWRVPVLGSLARSARQIPVQRNTPDAQQALVHAHEALAEGDVVAMFPEGTITADPDGWPMTARFGAARLALSHRIPVIPVAQTGTSALLGQKKLEWRRLFSLRRRPIHTWAGPAIDLERFRGEGEPSRASLEAASIAIMDQLSAMVAQLRGEAAPSDRFDMRAGRRVPQHR